MRSLALDVGSKTIGLALSDESGLIASAVGVLERGGHTRDAAAVVERVVKNAVQNVVVGWPLELDGREGRRARAVRQFVAVLEPMLAALDPAVSLHLWDERFSTAAAERTLIEADVSRARRKLKIDAVAAQYILQGWLDGRPRQAPEGRERENA